MTISIDLLRADKGGDPEAVRDSERRRFRDGKKVDEVIELDKQWVKAQYNTEQKRKDINAMQRDITERKKETKGKDDCKDLVDKKTKLEAECKSLEKLSDELVSRRDKTLGKIGNILHESVPVSEDEANNKVAVMWGVPRSFGSLKIQTDGFRPHFELLEMIGAVEFDSGHNVAGNRGYFLTGPGVLLNQALINYGLAFLVQRGYMPIQPPFMMKKDLMAKTAELEDYDEVLYKIVESPDKPDLDKYLIATSEQPISAFHAGQSLDRARFPLRYAGSSACFRREAGSSGRDIRGIFRVHQFEKIEQFVLTEPDQSWEEHESMIGQAEEFYQSLGIPYRVVAIVSKEINSAAAKKYDLEAWFPGDDEGKGKYRELVSCSNCTDYQARAMAVKYGYTPTDPFCHMLNSTLCATERALCCLVENYQEEGGVRVPRALVPYMLGYEFLPFVRPAPGSEGKATKKGVEAASKNAPASQKKEAAASPQAKAAPTPKIHSAPTPAPAAPQQAASGNVEERISAVGNQIQVLKEKLKGEGLSGKKINEHKEVKALVAELQSLKEEKQKGGGAAKEAKKEEKQKGGGAAKEAKKEAVDASPSEEDLAKLKKDKLKKAVKEGGKRGVEIEGAADMGGLQFFCTSVDVPEGDIELLLECLNAMNAKVDPTEEERKGGSGHIGKMIFSAGTEQLAIAAYVPTEKQDALSCEEWIKATMASHSGELLTSTADVCTGRVKADGDKGIFPLKIREPMILEANNFLRKRGLFPDNDSDDDEMVFGDDDFPS